MFTGYLRRKQQNDDLGLLMEERVPEHLSGKGVFAFETKYVIFFQLESMFIIYTSTAVFDAKSERR